METIVIWGTGASAKRFVDSCDPCAVRIAAYIDNNEAKVGSQYNGVRVLSPSDLGDVEYTTLVVASFCHEEIIEQLSTLGLNDKRVLVVEKNYPTLMNLFGKTNEYKELDDKQIALLESVNWYHSFELFPGVKTPGRQSWEPEKLNYFEAKESLQGKTVLDIGAWDGPYTFEMERRGADVTAFDIQIPERSGFYTAQKVNGSKAKYVRGSVYDLAPETHGTFDIVLFLGVYYHLQNPIQALSNIYSVLKPGGLMLFEGAILDGAGRVDPNGYWARHPELLKQCVNTPFCYYAKDKFENDWSNWSIPTAVCLQHWIESTGFEVLALDKMQQDARAYGAARKIDNFCDEEHAVC